MDKVSRLCSGGGLASMAFLIQIFTTSLAHADPQAINKCTLINAPGSYVLTKSIVAEMKDLTPIAEASDVLGCIVIAADFVTLDLQGHVLVGPEPQSGVITNAIISSGNPRGLRIVNGSATNFFNGVVLRGPGQSVERIRSFANGQFGIRVDSLAQNGHRLIGNTVMNNGTRGLHVFCPGVVRENVSVNNATPDVIAGDCTRAENYPAP